MTLDTDKSGQISYTEFIAAIISKDLYMQEEKLTEVFQLIDKDKKGYITSQSFGELVGENKAEIEFYKNIMETSI